MGAPWWLVASLLLAGAVLQASFFPALGFVAVRPDLVLICVVTWAVLRGAREAIVWGFAGGLILDLLSGAPPGTATLALVLVAFCCSIGEISFFKSTLILPVLTVFWGTVLYGLLYLFLLRTHQYNVEWLGSLRYIVVPNALLNTAVAPLVFLLLSRIERRTRGLLAVEW